MNRLAFRGPLADAPALVDALRAAGCRPHDARGKAELLARAAALLPDDRPTLAFFVPGRVEVLGKHTDYAGGRSMVIAAEQGVAVVAAPRDDEQITVRFADAGEPVRFPFNSDAVPRPGHWSDYPITVARRLARNFPVGLRGADIALASDLPPAAGMSSSSALVVASFLALDAVNGLNQRPEYQREIHNPTDLAGYLGTIENGQSFGSLEGRRGVGTFGGSEDHTAILCARPGQISQFAYCPVRFERAIPLPSSHRLAIGVSGVVAAKTGNALERYNAASRGAALLAELWRKATGRDDPHLAAALAAGPMADETLCEIARSSVDQTFDADRLLARLDHFLVENEQIIPLAGDALAAGDLAAFGREVDRSQAAAEQLLGNQTPETSLLSASARRLGASAASAFGAGFGGSVWALVEASKMDAFLTDWLAAYLQIFPQHAGNARFLATDAAEPAICVR